MSVSLVNREIISTDIYTWDELFNIHGTRNAINHSEENIISVLSGNDFHNDEIKPDKVIYKIPNRKYYKKSIERFNKQIINQKSFKLFHKLKTNSWAYLGEYLVSEINPSDKNYILIFIKAP